MAKMTEIKAQKQNTILSTIDERLFIIMKEKMNTDEQQQFIENFKVYLQYGNDDSKFVIDFDDVWKWVGFSEKGKAKRLLTGKFINDIDYIIQNCLPVEASNNDNNIFFINKEDQCNNNQYEESKNDNKRGGHNKEIIMLNVSTFKKFCMTASTKRAIEICDYYVKMENIMFQYTHEKLIEFQQKLLETQEKLNTFIEYDEELFWNENQIGDYDKKNVIYIAFIGIINNERIYKCRLFKKAPAKKYYYFCP
jgi:hypothetical protein